MLRLNSREKRLLIQGRFVQAIGEIYKRTGASVDEIKEVVDTYRIKPNDEQDDVEEESSTC